MKRTLWLILIVLLAGLVVACQEQPEAAPTLAPAEEPTVPEATAEPPAVPTDTPAAATAAATALPTQPPAVLPVAQFCDVVDPTLINLNTQGLYSEWQADCVEAGAYGAEPPEMGGLPQHITITFDGRASDTRLPGEPIIYIIPAAAYREAWDAAGDPLVGQQLDALARWIDRRPAAVATQQMPVLPIDEARATNDVAVQGQFLELDGWEGIRFVARFAQGPNPLTNEDLRYVFQGFAGEGDEVLVAAFFPVTTAHLPATSEEISAEDMAAIEADPATALNLATVELNALTDADWQPALDLLDELIGSLQYGGTETDGEAVEIDPTPDGRPSSYAVVSSAAGVNVRSGPSTAFPSLGLAPFGTELALIGRSIDRNWWATPINGAPDGRGWISAGFVEAVNTGALPVLAGPPLPTPVPLPTPEPTPAPQLAFWADRPQIDQGQCTTLRWSVANIQAVWVYQAGQNFEQFPATGDGSRQVCPATTTTYEMRVQLRDGSVTTQQVTVNVIPGNPLANSNWVLANIGGVGLLPGRPPTLSFGVGNYVEGFGGCNTFWGNYSLFGSNGLAMSVGTRSLVACPEDVTAQENIFLSALHSTGAFEINGDVLTLRDSGGVDLLRFLRQ